MSKDKGCGCGNGKEKKEEKGCCGGHDHKNESGCCGSEGHEEHESGLPTLNLEMEDGKEVECQVIGVFDVEEQDYIALLPEDSEEVYLYRFAEIDEEVELTQIESDEEYEKVSAVFMSLVEEETI